MHGITLSTYRLLNDIALECVIINPCDLEIYDARAPTPKEISYANLMITRPMLVCLDN